MKSVMKRDQERWPSFLNLFDVDRFFDDWSGRGGRSPAPSVNVAETAREYQIDVFAPRFKKTDFTVKVEDDMLQIRAESRQEDGEEKKNYTRKEYHYQSFTRAFRLPENVQEDQVAARYEDGVLKITVPKAEEEQARPAKQIEIS